MEVRHLKPSECIGGQKYLRRQQQIRNQQPHGHQRMHISRSSQAPKQRCNSKAINNMVNIKPIPRPLTIAKARERSVKAVSKPVNGKKDTRKQQPIVTVTR